MEDNSKIDAVDNETQELLLEPKHSQNTEKGIEGLREDNCDPENEITVTDTFKDLPEKQTRLDTVSGF